MRAGSTLRGGDVPQTTWRAGVARHIITPQRPLWLAGYSGRDHGAEGKLHELWIKALALEDPRGQRVVLVTSDVLGYSRAAVESLQAALQARFQLAPGQVLLSASHTHSGPVLRESLLDYYPLDAALLAQINSYSFHLEEQLVALVGAALADLSPAHLAWTTGECRFAVNRRANREAEVPDLLRRGAALTGPVDHQVPLLAAYDLQGTLRAVAFGYACHNTTLDGYQWCGDYAGFAQIEVESQFPGAVALFHAGCGADQNPLPRRNVALCQQYGTQLGRAVAEALHRPTRPVSGHLAWASRRIELPYEALLSREQIEAHRAAPGIRGRWAARLLARLDTGESFANHYAYPLAVWQLGDGPLWISLAGEAVVDYALRFRRQWGDATWTTAFAYDLVAYIPSRRVWEEGGYEGGSLYEYGLPAERWAGDVEERIAVAVSQLVAQVRPARASPQSKP